MNLAKAIEYSRKPIIMGKSEHKEKSTPKPKKQKPVERIAEYKPCECCGKDMFSLDYPQRVWDRRKYCSRECRSKSTAAQPCIINGIRYESQMFAAKCLNASYQRVQYCVNSDNYPEWVKV